MWRIFIYSRNFHHFLIERKIQNKYYDKKNFKHLQILWSINEKNIVGIEFEGKLKIFFLLLIRFGTFSPQLQYGAVAKFEKKPWVCFWFITIIFFKHCYIFRIILVNNFLVSKFSMFLNLKIILHCCVVSIFCVYLLCA